MSAVVELYPAYLSESLAPFTFLKSCPPGLPSLGTPPVHTLAPRWWCNTCPGAFPSRISDSPRHISINSPFVDPPYIWVHPRHCLGMYPSLATLLAFPHYVLLPLAGSGCCKTPPLHSRGGSEIRTLQELVSACRPPDLHVQSHPLCSP